MHFLGNVSKVSNISENSLAFINSPLIKNRSARDTLNIILVPYRKKRSQTFTETS